MPYYVPWVPVVHVPDIPINESRCAPEELAAKNIDLVIFGATGYMGKAFANYITSYVKDDIRWALAGRSDRKLEVEQQKIGIKMLAGVPPEVLLGDLTSSESLLNVTRRARIVINTAGPYRERGSEALIQAALNGCAHYIDIAAESVWRSDMMRKYEAKAVARGTLVVQSAGFITALTDILALHSARVMAMDQKGPPDTVFLSVQKMNGIPTGAGFQSGKSDLEGTKDPYLLVPEALPRQRVDRTLEGLKEYGFNRELGQDVHYYPGARMEPLLIRRTMLDAYPNSSVSVKQVCTTEFLQSFKNFVEVNSKLHFVPKGIQPPGEGPPPWMCESGSWKMEATSFRWNQARTARKRTRVVMAGEKDPTVSGTVRLCTSLALTLLEKGPYLGATGYRTPAGAVDMTALLERLKAVDGGHWLTIVHGFGPQEQAAMVSASAGSTEEVEEMPEAEQPLFAALEEQSVADRAPVQDADGRVPDRSDFEFLVTAVARALNPAIADPDSADARRWDQTMSAVAPG